ncbi:MAG TPA: hypothetical protein VFV38_07640 [Ktedonobacteraceae bacterium]|nr:hypothetical protein [Ktedonobacteraceae bacterium]
MDEKKKAPFHAILHFLTREEQEQLWEYVALTNYGTHYVPPERQAHLIALLHQLMKQEQLETLDFPSRLRRLALIKARVLQERGPFLELFSESA